MPTAPPLVDSDSRICADDFSCRVLSDIILEENGDSVVTGLLYGVNCTRPLIVPIPCSSNGEHSDYQTWLAFDDHTNIHRASLTLNHQSFILHCTLLFPNQANIPAWYINNLLSSNRKTWLGNALLILPGRNWPSECIPSGKEMARTLAHI